MPQYQEQELTQGEVVSLLTAMRKHNKNASIDWVNRTIRILSEQKTHPTKVLSNGPMKYQDILFEISQH